MADRLTDQERRMIDEYVAAGRVYHAAFGEACEDAHASKRQGYAKARKNANSLKSRQASKDHLSKKRLQQL